MKILYRGVFVENFKSSFGPKFRLWGDFSGVKYANMKCHSFNYLYVILHSLWFQCFMWCCFCDGIKHVICIYRLLSVAEYKVLSVVFFCVVNMFGCPQLVWWFMQCSTPCECLHPGLTYALLLMWTKRNKIWWQYLFIVVIFNSEHFVHFY